MLTRRKKQNIFYLFIGILIGVAVSSVVVSFQVIKRFTQENLERIHHLTVRDTVEVEARPSVRSVPVRTETVSGNSVVSDSLVEVDTTAKDAVDDIILSDMRISSVALSVPVRFSDTTRAETFRTLQLEQWESPMHFIGYKKEGQRVVIYGLNIDELEFYYRDHMLFIRYGIQELMLKETISFVRFPVSFLHQQTIGEKASLH